MGLSYNQTIVQKKFKSHWKCEEEEKANVARQSLPLISHRQTITVFKNSTSNSKVWTVAVLENAKCECCMPVPLIDQYRSKQNKLNFYSIHLFGPGGGTLCPPCHVFAYICANTHTSSLKKLDFSQLWVWKRAVHFLPRKVISFPWKK